LIFVYGAGKEYRETVKRDGLLTWKV